MAADPYKYFRIEAREILDGLSNGVLALEKPPLEPALLAKMLRLAHTLKGAARVVKLPGIADTTHAIEEVLEVIRDSGEASRERVERLLALLDELSAALTRLTADAPPAPVTLPTAPASNGTTPLLLAQEASELDTMLDGLSQLALELGEVQDSAARLERSSDLLRTLSRQLSRPGGAATRSGTQSTGELIAALERELAVVRRALDAGLGRAQRELEQARHSAESVRLVPARTLFATLERSARDAAHATGKSVTFISAGGDVRLDAAVLADVQPALIQLVRNAVAHGIERAGVRRAAGKPPDGRLTLAVERRWGKVLIRCSDDGAGIDLGAARRVAEERGLVPREVGPLDADAWLKLVLKGGISTAETVTQVSGRGVGLDVVRSAMERLSGELSVETRRDVGTTFTLNVPVTLSTVEVLLVQVAGVRVAFPLQSVRASVRVTPGELIATPEGAALRVDEALVPYGTLDAALGESAQAKAEELGSALLLRSPEGQVAVAVERIIGTEEVVVRSLPALAPPVPLVAGLWLDAAGLPQRVIDPLAAVRALRRAVIASAKGPSSLPILIVDDSLTTRMLEQSILESAGYQVVLAVSAEDGLEKARAQRFQLFLVDVEMPGMDGFGFVEAVRADSTLRDIPAIMVTSRNAPEDRERARSAGANGYMVKSEFDQVGLLATIRRLTEAR